MAAFPHAHPTSIPISSVEAAIVKTESAKIGGNMTATITQKNEACPIVSDGLLETISTNVAASAMQHRNQVFSVLRERSAGITHENAPGSPFLWVLAGGFSEPLEDMEKRRERSVVVVEEKLT